MYALNQESVIDVPAVAIENGQNPMIEKISIKNFRCFSSLELTNLKRINVIVGRNSSGKTSLLESIFISSGAAVPNQAFQLRALRHLGNQIQIAADARSYVSLWSDLWHWFETDKTILIELKGSNLDSRSMKASFTQNNNQLLPLGDQPISPASIPQVEFIWERAGHIPVTVRPMFTPLGLNIQGATSDHFPLILFAPSSPDIPDEHAKRFSAMSVDGEIHPIIEAMIEEFPSLESLAVEYFGATPSIYASLVGGKRKMPLGLVSDGINKLMGILLGIAACKNGVVLIEQIEDGFYFDRLESIWRLIHKAAVKNNCQIFATTHSRECLSALPSTIEGNEEDFCLLRSEDKPGQFGFNQVSGKSIKSALRQGFDPR
jgi:AAA15 family ATPase/GTPase